MIEKINIDGQNVSAELHALMYDYVYGYNGVFDYGKKLSHEVISNNEIRINDGLIISQGRFMRIVTGSYESIAIENGTSGVNRCDLIVAHFETDGINETYDIRVIKGTGASEPSYTTGDTFNGARVHEMPLYAVHLEGLSIARVERKFSLILSVDEHRAQLSNPNLLINSDFRNPINQRGKTIYNGANSKKTYTIDHWYILNDDMKLTVNANSITIESIDSVGFFTQPFEKAFNNKTYTFSCNVKQISGSAQIYSEVGDVNYSNMVPLKLGFNEIVIKGALDNLVLCLSKNSSIELEWFKLEPGAFATPFVPRPYCEKLLLCQDWLVLIHDIHGNFNGKNLVCTLHTKLRNTPSLNLNGGQLLSDGINSSDAKSLGILNFTNGSVSFQITGESTFGSGVCGRYRNGTIMLSCEPL